MEQNIGQMMPAGSQAPDVHIEHMRQPGYGMPVANGGRGKRPVYAFQGKSVADMSVVGYV